MIKEASAEERAQTGLEGTRRHDEKMKLAGSLKHLAADGHMVISG
jgi:hypothetical protein